MCAYAGTRISRYMAFGRVICLGHKFTRSRVFRDLSVSMFASVKMYGGLKELQYRITLKITQGRELTSCVRNFHLRETIPRSRVTDKSQVRE